MKIFLHDYSKGLSVQKIEDSIQLDNEDQSNMVTFEFSEGDQEFGEFRLCLDDLEAAIVAFKVLKEPLI